VRRDTELDESAHNEVFTIDGAAVEKARWETAFRGAYSRFLKPGRVLFTGHSHQAWPDVARDAMDKYFDISAELVDDKWSGDVMPLLDRVGRRVLARLGFSEDGAIAFGKSTHELVYRLLTCLPERPRIVTTTGEFHSLDRQLLRLAEAGARVRWVEAEPRASLAERLAAAVGEGADLVAASYVLFEDARIVRGLGEVIERATATGALALIDAYHAFNVVPLESSPAWEKAFVTAGGYKYAQFGEGVCFLRIPDHCDLRPVYTGWFADFESLEHARGDRGSALAVRVGYGAKGARFAGATFDPVGLYRADAVLNHFDRFGLDVARLSRISRRMTSRISAALINAGFDVVSPVSDAERGGFVAVRVAQANEIVQHLRKQHIVVDARGSILRLGPAPYLTDDEIDLGIEAVVTTARRQAPSA
jgi:kynureninase